MRGTRRTFGAVFIVCFLLASCTSSTEIKSVPIAQPREEIKNLLVVNSIHGAFGNREFVSLLSTRLTACGIDSKHIYVMAPFDAFNKPDLDKILAEGLANASGYKHDAILQVVVTATRFSNITGRVYDYSARAFDRDHAREIWRADLTLVTRYSPGFTEKATTFVSDLMGILIKDGVIRTCPPETS